MALFTHRNRYRAWERWVTFKTTGRKLLRATADYRFLCGPYTHPEAFKETRRRGMIDDFGRLTARGRAYIRRTTDHHHG